MENKVDDIFYKNNGWPVGGAGGKLDLKDDG